MYIQSRNCFIDTIKGATIILVVAGHNLRWGDPIFKFIYGFHMPLFAVVSGYLFYYSIEKRNLFGIIRQKIITIGIPIVVWGGLMLVVTYRNVAFSSMLSFLTYYRMVLGSQLWFLWALLGCSFLVIAIRYFLGDSVIAYIVFLLICPVISDAYYLGSVKFLYPYFAFGYLLHRFYVWDIMKESFWEHKKCVLPILLLLYIVLLLLFHHDTYFYTTGITVLGKEDVWYQLWNDGVRLVTGFVGCILVIGCMACMMCVGRGQKSLLYGRMIDILARIGQCTMGIYIINWQTIPLLQRITQDLSYNIGLVVTETIIMTAFCWGATEILYRIKGVSGLLFGKWNAC